MIWTRGPGAVVVVVDPGSVVVETSAVVVVSPSSGAVVSGGGGAVVVVVALASRAGSSRNSEPSGASSRVSTGSTTQRHPCSGSAGTMMANRRPTGTRTGWDGSELMIGM